MSRAILKLKYKKYTSHVRRTDEVFWSYEKHGGKVLIDAEGRPLQGVSSSYSWAMQDSQDSSMQDRLAEMFPNGYYLITEGIQLNVVDGEYWEAGPPPEPDPQVQEDAETLRGLRNILKKLV